MYPGRFALLLRRRMKVPPTCNINEAAARNRYRRSLHEVGTRVTVSTARLAVPVDTLVLVGMSEGEQRGDSSSTGVTTVERSSTGGRPLQIGDEIPNFTCDSHMGMITLHGFIDGGWGVIFT